MKQTTKEIPNKKTQEQTAFELIQLDEIAAGYLERLRFANGKSAEFLEGRLNLVRKEIARLTGDNNLFEPNEDKPESEFETLTAKLDRNKEILDQILLAEGYYNKMKQDNPKLIEYLAKKERVRSRIFNIEKRLKEIIKEKNSDFN